MVPPVTDGAQRRGPWPPAARLLWLQVKTQFVQFLRIPVAMFFTVVLPLLMLILFNSIFAGHDVTVEGPAGDWPLRQFYVASLATVTAVSGTFTNLANIIPDRREAGVLKRWRGTPLPRWAYLGGFVGSGVVIALAGFILMLVVGVVFYDTDVDAAKLPAAAVAFVAGTAAFSALGVAVAGLIRKAEAAPAVANAVILPMAFLSNTFVPIDESSMPRWIDVVSAALPLRPFVESMQGAFNPTVDAPAFDGDNLVVLVLWGVAGSAVAWRYFKWEPVTDVARLGQRSRRRRRRRANGTETAGD
jgi:ABC-2 type transport system permease protein